MISKLKNVNKLAETIGLFSNDKEITSRENPTDNGNVTNDSQNKKETAKQNIINTVTQNIENPSDKIEIDTTGMRKLLVTLILGDSMVKDIKGLKMSSRTRKIEVQKLRT